MGNLSLIPVNKLYGVGKVRSLAYQRMGIETVSHLLYHFPRAFEDRGTIRLLRQAPPDSKCALLLTVATQPKCANIRRGMTLLRFRVYDDSGTATVTFFNQIYLRDSFELGQTYRFFGKVERQGQNFSLSSPAFEPWDPQKPLPGLYPVYPTVEGLTQKQIAQNMTEALAMAATDCPDPLPADIRRTYELCPLIFALHNIHTPGSTQDLAVAKKRLIFDEFFTFALGTAVASRQVRLPTAPPCPDTDLTAFLATLPYALTGAQMRAIRQIGQDMTRNVPMRRILVGDVGCGKTVCAAAAMYMAVKNGKQAVLMAPTEILARQHVGDLSRQFEKLGIRVALLTGAMTAAQKKRVYEGLTASDRSERIDIVIGTHALLSEGVAFAAPGLVVTDEQHRFGAAQRAVLSSKGHETHMLVMSATPIPRSMALMLYGDLDVCRIDEMPPGRQRVDTFVVGESYRERLNAFILKNIEEGGQVYVVCPAVEDAIAENAMAENATADDGEESILSGDIPLTGGDCYSRSEAAGGRPPLKSATGWAEALRQQLALPPDKVGLVHGRMKSDEKQAVMERFVKGDIAVLVATTVIEVGVNVPNATLMVVENADRFGLSQLHQLRGRVGRGQRKAYCVLVSDVKGETARQRLEVMHTTYDGYAIAEEDLKQRGPGDFFRGASESGIRQSGGLRFRLADLCDDASLMAAATSAAHALLDSDPSLSRFPALRSAVEEMFSVDSGTLS